METFKRNKTQNTTDIIIGLHPVMEAIKAGKSFVKILFKRGLKGDIFHDCLNLANEYDIPTQYVPIEKLNKFSMKNHQGVIAIVSPIPYQDISNVLPGIYESGKDPFLLILDGITDIRNFGAISRSAEAAGVNAIILGEKKAAMINSDAIKTSAGALNRIPVCREKDLAKTVTFLQESGILLVGATEKATELYYNVEMNGPVAIVMGAEDTGISDGVMKKLDNLVKIPMNGSISSLNVSVACGILLFEVVKQQLSKA